MDDAYFQAQNDLAESFMAEFEHFGGDDVIELDEPKEEDDMSGASGLGHEPNDPENER